MLPTRVLALVCGCLPLLASVANAKVGPSPIGRLAEASDLIVLAKIQSVSGQPSGLDRRAKATVTEVWKGPGAASVEFLASPTWTCDISNAEPGEAVLLFLSKEKEAGWVISSAGRGRMPLVTRGGKTYVTPFVDVILPPGTPSIASPAGSSGGFDRAVELDTVRDLVKRAIRDKR